MMCDAFERRREPKVTEMMREGKSEGARLASTIPEEGVDQQSKEYQAHGFEVASGQQQCC